MNIVNVYSSSLLKGIAPLALDKEKSIRREALKALSLILAAVSNDQLKPFSGVLISYLKCAMTHINNNIMEDSLLFLDILIQHCDCILVINSSKLFLYFLDMISKLRNQAQPGRQLTINLKSKNTSMKWRLKVLNSLQQFMMAIVRIKKNFKNNFTARSKNFYYVENKRGYYPIYSSNRLQTLPVNFENDDFSKSLNPNVLHTYIDSLMPLMFESWQEACPKKVSTCNSKLPLSNEVVFLLQSIVSIIESIIKYLSIIDSESGTSESTMWFKSKFQNSFIKNLFSDFPYEQQNFGVKLKKSCSNFSNDCLEQNLTLCYIFIWFTTVNNNSKFDNLNKNICSQMLQFLIGKYFYENKKFFLSYNYPFFFFLSIDKLENWNNDQMVSVSHLIKVLKILFLKACPNWYKNKVPLGNVLKSAINIYLGNNKKELKTQIFLILNDIVMNHNLNYLHR